MPIKQEYNNFLDKLKKTNRVIDLLHKPSSNMICLRHDVDYNLELAHEMAFIEYKKGFQSSFYFLPSAEYFDSVYLIKTLQEIQSFGHEIGIHFNGLAELLGGKLTDIDESYKKINLYLNEHKIYINGISCHGDALCYKKQLSNHWYFEDNKKFYYLNKNYIAEGPESNLSRSIKYSKNSSHTLEKNFSIKLFNKKLSDLGWKYDAYHTNYDQYFSDSGGQWLNNRNPLDFNLQNKRVQILVHPEAWNKNENSVFLIKQKEIKDKEILKHWNIRKYKMGEIAEDDFNQITKTKIIEVPNKKVKNSFFGAKDIYIKTYLYSLSYLSQYKNLTNFFYKYDFIDYLKQSSNFSDSLNYEIDTEETYNQLHFKKSLSEKLRIKHNIKRAKYFFVVINFKESLGHLNVNLIHHQDSPERQSRKIYKLFQKNIFYFSKSSLKNKYDLFLYVNKKFKLKTKLKIYFYYFK